MDAYVSQANDVLQKISSDRLIADLVSLYDSGNASEKAMVLTVLAAVKMYFGESNHEQFIV